MQKRYNTYLFFMPKAGGVVPKLFLCDRISISTDISGKTSINRKIVLIFINLPIRK